MDDFVDKRGLGALDRLEERLEGHVLRVGSDGYKTATSPRNITARQDPLAVAAVVVAEDVAACVSWAREVGLRVVLQATGHGAAGVVGGDCLLIDTSRLNGIEIDVERRLVRAGAGATFAAINEAAFAHGLLAPGGTAPDVALAGYVAYGGIGWLTRPHGLASASLEAVDFIDGFGALRRADAEHDPNVLWAYRGGGGVGVATRLQLKLFEASDLWGGYLLWPASDGPAVITAWGQALSELHPALCTTIGILRAPDAPTVPDALRGQPVVHLSAASIAGREAVADLRKLLAGLPTAAIDTLGPCDSERLATIHLDPPVPVPALGDGRWLSSDGAAHALEILTACGTGLDSPLSEIELRHLACPASSVRGALTHCPGDLLLHAVGPAPTAEGSRAVQHGLERVLAAAAPVDTGHSAASFRDGQTDALDALDQTARRRLGRVQHEVDPQGLISPARVLH